MGNENRVQEDVFWRLVTKHCGNFQPRTIEMARAVLVEGALLKDVALKHKVTLQRVHLAKKQVLASWGDDPKERLKGELFGTIDQADVPPKTKERLQNNISKVLK